MYRTVCVMALVALCAGLAHSFSWEIVKVDDNGLKFIHINRTISHTENFWWMYKVVEITYDPVHNRMLFADEYTIFSFDITTKKTERLMRAKVKFTGLAYDPATELLIWIEDYRKIFSITLKPESDKNKVNEKHFILSEQFDISRIAVDSCGGFIYFLSNYNLNKVRINGSEKEVVIDGLSIVSFTIDQQAQKIYFADSLFIKSADLNGMNLRTILVTTQFAYCLTVSKDFMYWRSLGNEFNKHTIQQIPKNPPLGIDVKPKTFSQSCESVMVAYCNINDIVPEEIQTCDNLRSLLPNNSVFTDVSLLCVHGAKVDGESRCECTQGYSGERCEVSVCHNYCLNGDCSTSADGQPKCRCNAGYSGERCEVNACQGYCLYDGICSLSEESKPVCQCAGDYEGDRCDVSVCQGYCLHGDCSTSADGQPKCRCTVGYVGERCEVNACLTYCLHDGVCSLSEQNNPVCQCTAGFKGERCDVTAFHLLKDADLTSVTEGKAVKSTCACQAVAVTAE